jgi:hypothetical protein
LSTNLAVQVCRDENLRTRLIALFWFAPAVAVLLFWPRVFPLDDAYITMHNARSLLEGGDPVFGGSPLLGATSGVHVLSMAILALVVQLPTAALLISATCACLYAWGLWRLQKNWAFVGVGLLASFIPIHLLNGLETSMALAAVVWSLVLADSKWLPLLLGMLPYVRPDLLLLAVPLGARQLRSSPTRVMLLAAITSVPLATWYFIETGAPFPNTAEAKSVFFGEYLESLAWRAEMLGKALLASNLLILAPGLVGLARARAGWCGLIYIAGVLAIALVTLPGALHFNDSRYMATFVPILCYGLVRLPEFVTFALASASVVTGVISLAQLRTELAAADQWFDGARFVATLPAGTTVLVHDVGVVAWLKPKAKLIDVVGLKSPASVPVMRKYKVHACQWGQALSEIARRSNAQYVEVLQVPMWECIGSNLKAEGWTLTPVHEGRMTIFALTPPRTIRMAR